MPPHLRIRSLTIALVALLLAVLGLQAWILTLNHQRVIEATTVRAANRAQAIANQVQATFRQVDLLLQGLRDHIDADEAARGPEALAPGRTLAMRGLLREHMARLPLVKWLNVFSANGRPLFTTLERIPGIDIADRAFFQQLRTQSDDALSVSDLLVSRSTGRWAVFLSRRLVASDGSFAGLVVAALESESLESMFTAVDPQSCFALCDRTGRLVARWPHLAEQIGETAEAIVLDAAQDGVKAVVAKALGETETMIWDAQRIAGLPLTAVVGYGQRLALEQWRRALRIHLAVALLLAAGCASILVLHRLNLRAAEEQQAREAYFRAIFDVSPVAVAVLEAGRVIDANRCYCELFRIPVGHPVPPWELAPQAQPDGVDSAAKGERLAAAARIGGLQHCDWRCQRSDGGEFEADISISSVLHRGRDLLIVVIRDLTQMRELEEKLRQGQKLEALGQLAGGIAHDFNNMLAAILGSAEIIAARSTDAQVVRRHNSTIVSAAERASQLTRKLLSFARKGKILSTPVDLHDLLRETVALLERTIDPRVVIALRLHAPTASVVGDPAQIQNAILNLCLNARDAMPGGGSLTLATDQVQLDAAAGMFGSFRLVPGEYLRLTVADSGCGISAEHLQRIFDPFFTTKEVGKGTGLGLASVYGTMVSHLGGISVASTLGKGTTFTLLFPVAQVGQVQGRTTDSRPSTGSGPVLVIDDEDMVRTAIALQLEDLGYTPIAVGDVDSAETEFRARHTELVAVLLDLVMPKASGVDVALRLRDIDPTVPIIMVSGFPRNAEVKDLLDTGVAGFLQKPFRQAELAQTIAQIRRREVS